jgi:membrane associated rhomboid family serine protease
MADPVTLRTDAGDDRMDLQEFEVRVSLGEVSPQSLVRFPQVTGDAFVPACELEVFKRLNAPRAAHFARAFSLTRFPWMTSAVIIAQLAIFLATARGAQLELDDMVRFGGKVGPLIGDLGQFWRLLTANLLHRDALHLGVNMFVLFNVGGALENTYRKLDYVWLLVFSSAATMLTSLFLNDAITIGASGTVFGCLGGLVAFGLRYRALLPSRYRSVLGDAAIPTVLALLWIGFTSHGVDNWAHTGGLLAGALVGAFMRPQLLSDGAAPRWRTALRGAPSVALVAGLLVAGHFAPSPVRAMNMERIDDLGLSVPLPRGWLRGANPMGTLAWYNGLSGLGRASFAVELMEPSPGSDLMDQARRFSARWLQPRVLGPDVLAVSSAAPESVRVAEHDGARVRAVIEEPSGTTQLSVYFVARGAVTVQLSFLQPDAFPAYAEVFAQMLARLKFGEPKALRIARAEALFLPNEADVLARLGTALLSNGETLAAADVLNRAVRAAPGVVGYRAALARAGVAGGGGAAGGAAAEAAMTDALDSVEALEAGARCELARGQFSVALRRLEQARALEPADERLKAAEQRLRETMAEPRTHHVE